MIMRALILLTLLISACSTPPTSQQGNWLWQISGKIYYKSPDERGSANLFWQHGLKRDNIQLSGPLGQGATRFIITPEQSSLWQDGEEKSSARTIDQLLSDSLPWTIPVDGIRRWVSGDVISTSFNEDGWQVELSKLDSLKRPGKVVATKQNYKLTLLISQWTQ